MVNFWHTANLAFSDEERAAFNAWKSGIYDASEKLRSEANRLPDEARFSYFAEKAREMHKIVCAVPFLSGE